MSEQRLSVAEIGVGGPRVVFLHGLFGQGKNFQSIARGLEPEWRSLLVDLPNHGTSPWTERIDYAEMADAVAATLRALPADDGSPVTDASPPRFAVVGHSMG